MHRRCVEEIEREKGDKRERGGEEKHKRKTFGEGNYKGKNNQGTKKVSNEGVRKESRTKKGEIGRWQRKGEGSKIAKPNLDKRQ